MDCLGHWPEHLRPAPVGAARPQRSQKARTPLGRRRRNCGGVWPEVCLSRLRFQAGGRSCGADPALAPCEGRGLYCVPSALAAPGRSRCGRRGRRPGPKDRSGCLALFEGSRSSCCRSRPRCRAVGWSWRRRHRPRRRCDRRSGSPLRIAARISVSRRPVSLLASGIRLPVLVNLAHVNAHVSTSRAKRTTAAAYGCRGMPHASPPAPCLHQSPRGPRCSMSARSALPGRRCRPNTALGAHKTRPCTGSCRSTWRHLCPSPWPKARRRILAMWSASFAASCFVESPLTVSIESAAPTVATSASLG
jgi:hypothetical protein